MPTVFHLVTECYASGSGASGSAFNCAHIPHAGLASCSLPSPGSRDWGVCEALSWPFLVYPTPREGGVSSMKFDLRALILQCRLRSSLPPAVMHTTAW